MSAIKEKLSQLGTSMIEVVVMAAIVAMLSAIIVEGFGRGNQGAFVKRGAEQLALSIRQAQSFALTGKVSPTLGKTPKYWGLHLDVSNPNSIIIFGDINEDLGFTSNEILDETFQTTILEEGVHLITLSSERNGPDTLEDKLNFLFSVPFGELTVTTVVNGVITDAGGSGNVIIQSAKDNFKKKITAQVSGHVVISSVSE